MSIKEIKITEDLQTGRKIIQELFEGPHNEQGVKDSEKILVQVLGVKPENINVVYTADNRAVLQAVTVEGKVQK